MHEHVSKEFANSNNNYYDARYAPLVKKDLQLIKQSKNLQLV